MQLLKFQQILQAELDAIIADPINENDTRLHAHKKEEDKRGYALLVWFLKFYGQKDLYRTYITDGKGDYSCDIIFSNRSAKGKTIFYVVQSKNIQPKDDKKSPQISKEELNAAVAEFRQLLSGTRLKSNNEIFNEKYAELLRHLENNGEVKFVFFSPAAANKDIDAEGIIRTFEADNKGARLEIIDGERLRTDYIERKYKEIKSNNPLEYSYNAETSDIILHIEREENTQRDIFEFQGRAKAVLVLLRPSTVYKLFNEYGFSLFFSNVRNPLPASNYNEKIVDTLLRRPDAFWFFNNGITAITRVLPPIGVMAKKINVEGLQIINGAQTVYSVFAAYEKASPAQRKSMDAYARISCRLIGSADDDFNLQITRYTNMQNPMQDSDFWANDAFQKRLQQESFATNFWYQTRRGEFRFSEEQEKALGVSIVPNERVAGSYLAFYLQKPNLAQSKNLFFVSRRDNPKGLYELIFEHARYENLLAADIMFPFILEEQPQSLEDISNNLLSISTNTDERQFSFLVLALSAVALQTHLSKKFAAEKPVQLAKYIIEAYYSNKIAEIAAVVTFTNKWALSEFNNTKVNYELLAEELREHIQEKGLVL